MKLTLTSNETDPVIRVEDINAFGRTHTTLHFTAEDLRQLNEFAATCPTFKVFGK